MNADLAFIDASKVRDYLLSPSHPVGRFKAKFFAALGYTQLDWELLSINLLEIARAGQIAPGQPSGYGQKYEASGTLIGPNGRKARVTTVWVIRPDEQVPRFVTAFPE